MIIVVHINILDSAGLKYALALYTIYISHYIKLLYMQSYVVSTNNKHNIPNNRSHYIFYDFNFK